MDYERNREILLKLLLASNSEETEAIITNEELFQHVKWVSYGRIDNNAGIIDQMLEPENALIEKITNSIDAILMRKCLEEGIDPMNREKAPRSMLEAINRYFGGKEKIRGKRSEMAKKLLRLSAEGKKERPTITVIDRGEGQTPENIKETILSLHKNIKEKIPFVYGTYNKGGSSTLGFTGNPGKYDVSYLQLVLCRRAPTIKEQRQFDNDEHFGFTVVRKRFDNLSCKFTYEYFVDSSSERILSVPFEKPIEMGDYKFSDGCVIKLYDYQLKIPGNIVFRGLNEIIEKKIPDSPLPIYLSELRDYKGDRDYTIFGLREKLERRRQIMHKGYPQKLPVDLGAIGKRDVNLFVLEHKTSCKEELGTYLLQKERVFFIRDGLVLNTENLSWIRNDCDLPDLAPYLFLFIDISNINPALAQMLHSGREKFKNNETTRLALQRLQLFLESETFKELNDVYGRLSAGDTTIDDKNLKRQLMKDIGKQPELREIFELGEDLLIKDKEPGEKEREKPPFEGSHLPTKFELVGQDPKEIEEGSFCKVTFETEAEEQLFVREIDRGEYDWSKSDRFYVTMQSFRQGKISFRVDHGEMAPFNTEEKINFFLKIPSKSIVFNKEVGFILRPKIPYVGKEYPTFFKFSRKIFKLPVESERKLNIYTDASNDYFDKKGEIEIEERKDISCDKIRLKDGILGIRVKCLIKRQGEAKDLHIAISDSHNKFDIDIPIEITPPGTNPDLKLPEPIRVWRDEWQNDQPPWDENIIARIPSWRELKKIKINMDSKAFEDLRKQIVADRDIARDVLLRQIFIGSIWHFLEFKDLSLEQNGTDRDPRDEVFERAIRATTKYILQKIKNLMR